MKLTFCAACGAMDHLQHHPVVMRSEGGSADEQNLITLCATCHVKLHERGMKDAYHHGQLTRAGMAVAKAKGKKFGGSRGNEAQLRTIRQRNADERAAKVLPIIKPMREQGATLQAIADRLTAMGIGSRWTPMKVKRTLERLKSSPTA